jgi:hypothetical protein
MTLSLPPGYLNLRIKPATKKRPLLAKLRPDDPTTWPVIGRHNETPSAEEYPHSASPCLY